MKLLSCALVVLAVSGAFAQETSQAQQQPPQSKLGKFLGQPSTRYVSKKVNLPEVPGLDDDTFFFEVVSAQSVAKPEVTVRGVRFSGYHYSRVGGTSRVAFFDEDEIPSIVAAIRQIVTDAKPASDVDMGELGKQKVMEVIRIVSREGTEFTYDETLVGNYRVTVGYQSFNAGSKEAFTKIADNLEKAAAILKKL